MSSIALYLIFRHSLLLNPELVVLGGLAGQRAPGICSPLAQLLPGFSGPELGLSGLYSRPFLTHFPASCPAVG